jgi:hypothetical protein
VKHVLRSVKDFLLTRTTISRQTSCSVAAAAVSQHCLAGSGSSQSCHAAAAVAAASAAAEHSALEMCVSEVTGAKKLAEYVVAAAAGA